MLLHRIRCQRCKRGKKKPESFPGENDMDPGEVPAEPRGLTQVEETLIARTSPITRVYRVKGGQIGYGDHVTNVTQGVGAFLKRLPRASTDTLVVVVRREGNEHGTHKDFLARQRKVLGAFVFFSPSRRCTTSV